MNRPQPIGIFPFPANLLLLEGASHDEQTSLMNGVASGPDYFRAAIEGDAERALACLGSSDSEIAIYNRLVLDPSPENFSNAAARLSGTIGELGGIASFMLGLIESLPSSDSLDGEFAALVLTAKASLAIENGDIDSGLSALHEAATIAEPVSPAFAAQIRLMSAEATHQFRGADANVADLYRTAIRTLSETGLDEAKATAAMNLGICCQQISEGNRGVLLEAVRNYQESLKFYTRESHPEQFAFVQNNLALAYLSIPLIESSDQLRVAIAIQALREALRVYRRESHGELWASTQLNLANALQYAPSSHVEENLKEAVNLYEEILEVRNPNENPAGYARLLANQGNALAHLGVFGHAVSKLTEAQKIFSQIGETDSAAAVAETLAEIGERSAAAGG